MTDNCILKMHLSAIKDIYLRFQVLIFNVQRSGKISSRPASISKIRTNLENMLKPPKLQVGPTVSSPGPTLLKQATTAEKFVVIEKLSIDISIKLKIRINE